MKQITHEQIQNLLEFISLCSSPRPIQDTVFIINLLNNLPDMVNLPKPPEEG